MKDKKRFNVKSGNVIGGSGVVTLSEKVVAADMVKVMKALRNFKCRHGKFWRNSGNRFGCKICMACHP